jgi:PPK2 family polyphosphate:nucleotide phosphotransferase
MAHAASTAKELLGPWQPPVDGDGRPFSLRELDPAARPFLNGDKAASKTSVDALAEELDTLQNLFLADRRYKLLVVLQGMDTSGKDGTIRGVFGRMSALGVRTIGWKAPNAAEQAHDYLWRIHQQVPGAGEVTLFNRSHYEDVLVPVVNGQISPERTRQRFAHINAFERMLSETGTVILKFMLHISFEEQGRRLQERVDDPTKHWKFSMGDLDARKQWTTYQQAYEALLGATSTLWAPLDRGALGLQDAPQPDDCHPGPRHPEVAGPALPAQRSGPEGPADRLIPPPIPTTPETKAPP